MSVDQAILETADETGLVTLRFYTWSQPTLSLGYFQNHASRNLHPTSLPCPLVRRRTGGGAIVHDQELTYSLCVPSKNRWSAQNSDLYRLVHRAIIEVLSLEGIAATLYEDSSPATENAPVIDANAFLCFERRSDGDIVASGHKIVGSAQRRLKNSLLQHGSILLARSSYAPELPGLQEIRGQSQDANLLSEKLALAIARRLQIGLKDGKLSPSEQQAAKTANSTLFDSNEWNLRR